MKTLKNKMKNKKGFTLMEMLIVIAIMVVLMAIALPAFGSQLNGAKETTDKANLRTAKSVAQTMLVTGDSALVDGTTYYFDIDDCVFKTTNTADYGESDANKAKVIGGEYDKDAGTFNVDWMTP